MDTPQDLYQALGVPPAATPDDIRFAYRALARRLHPDVNQNPGAAAQFRDIAAAHNLLNDPVERQKYDMSRRRIGDNNYFSMRVTTGQRSLMALDEQQVFYLLVELMPERTRSLQQMDSRLNLTLVLDHSTSMRGQRLDRVKAAAHQIIEHLNPEDVFSVVSFSDAAEVIIKAAPLANKPEAKARIMIMQASGGTEIYQGLLAGVTENRRNASRRHVNHIILLTDGRTFADEPQTLELADKAAKEGISISAMGIGDEWNDSFLDEIASRTGGTSEYISSPLGVARFLNDRVRSLGQSYAERVTFSIAPDPDLKIESAFRLMPTPQPLSADADPIPLGTLQNGSAVSVLYQIQVAPQTTLGVRSLVRVEATGDVLREQRLGVKVIQDLSTEIKGGPINDEPPFPILDALNKLTLYRLQEKAESAITRGDHEEATRHLRQLETRLMAAGQPELAAAAGAEAQRVSNTRAFSGEGQKALKYGTRLLLASRILTGNLSEGKEKQP